VGDLFERKLARAYCFVRHCDNHCRRCELFEHIAERECWRSLAVMAAM
jgi:hypothetical protein